jgi:hypothetical protein
MLACRLTIMGWRRGIDSGDVPAMASGRGRMTVYLISSQNPDRVLLTWEPHGPA